MQFAAYIILCVCAASSVCVTECMEFNTYDVVKNICISTDILWQVNQILTEPVPYTFVSVNRRNSEAPVPNYTVSPRFIIPSICECKRLWNRGSDKMWKTHHQNIRRLDIRIFFTV